MDSPYFLAVTGESRPMTRGLENLFFWSTMSTVATRDVYSPAAQFEHETIHPPLSRRKQSGSLRRLIPFHGDDAVDFSSNDYLGLAQSPRQLERVETAYSQCSPRYLGSTGSRLLTGDSDYATKLEEKLAKWHKRPAALLCNSGYDANLAVMSSLTRGTQRVILDEYCHNSIRMGLLSSKGDNYESFPHNDLKALERLLASERARHPQGGTFIVVVESVYSMDGDQAPLDCILNLGLRYNACVIVDEAHALGLFGESGMGLLTQLNLEKHPALLCSIHTFGKAAGCHGAVVCGSTALKEYLLNYGRPVVYSTSLPLHSLVAIGCAYDTIASAWGKSLRSTLESRIGFFRHAMLGMLKEMNRSVSFLSSASPIHALLLPGNTRCIGFCATVLKESEGRVRLYPIRSPTVPQGKERIRIIIHAHNTESEVSELVGLIRHALLSLGCGASRKTLRSKL